MRTAALILAAGKGTRVGGETPKQLLPVSGKPMFLHSVERFRPFADVLAVVTGEDRIPEFRAILDGAGFPDVLLVPGGEERMDSSYNGLRTLSGFGADLVLIHDAARCLVTDDVIARVLAETKRSGACTAAVPLSDTVKRADDSGTVLETPPRAGLFLVQTPQGFSFPLILSAYEKMLSVPDGKIGITDDCMAVERFTDHAVKLVPGDPDNLKVTHPRDLFLAEALLQRRKNVKED